MILVAILIILAIAGIMKHLSLKPMRDAVANMNGPFCVPLLGAFHLFTKLNPENFVETGAEMVEKYGKIIKVWAFNRLLIASSDIELNEQLLSSTQHIVKHRNYKMLHQWLGVGLLMSDGKKWFNRRKIITPTFHFKILEQFVEVFDQQSSVLVEKLTEKADGKTAFNVYPFICLAALDIIAETAMGTKVYAQQKKTDYAVAVNRMTKHMAWRFMKIHLNNEIVFTLLYPHLKLRQMRLIRTMHDFTIKVIEERRQLLEAKLHDNSADAVDYDEFGNKKRMALLDILLQSTIDGKPLLNEDIREEVDTFMFEGHDTTTSAISFALHYLARYPKVQQKLYDEVVEVLGAPNSKPITLHDLNELKYMECVIKETLRLYPSVPVIGREIQTDFKYKHSTLGEGTIPAGTEFLIVIHGMMRDPERFTDPHEFNPDRHLNNESIGAFALIPFSAGPRNCIGQKFAMLEMKTVIGKVVREYELLPFGDDVKPEMNIVMRSSNGFQLGMRKRLPKK